MKLASSLALKWLGGIAAVGGATGGVLCYKAGYFGGNNETKDKEVPEEVPANQSGLNDIPTTDKALAQERKAEVAVDGADPSNKDPVTPTNDNQQASLELQIIEDDEMKLLTGCENSYSCILDKESIKKVKFQALGEGNDPVTVSSSDISLSVTVLEEENNKRYVFENNGSEKIILSRGSSSTLEIPVGKSRFVADNKKLKAMEMGKYGLPKICETNKICTLIGDDLGLINFSDFTGTEEATITNPVSGLIGQYITLTIEDNKYIFNNPNSSSITITKSEESSVDLDPGETEFKVDNGKLKKLEPWSFGLPEDCKLEDTTDSKTCSLSLRDLKKIKFKDVDTVTSISGLKDDEKVSLEIKKANDSSYPDGRKYIFTPKGSSDVTITGAQTITLSKTEENIFKKGRNFDFLVEIPKRTTPTEEIKALDEKIKGLGLPDSCTFTNKASGSEKSMECELSLEELKKVKFSVGEISSVSGGHGEENNHSLGDPKTYKIKIEEPTENEDQFKNENIRITFLNRGENIWSSNLIITGNASESNTLTISNNSNAEFKINDKKKIEMAWNESTLSDQVGLKCPKETEGSDNSCTLKSDDGSIKVLIEGKEKEFKVNKTDIENNMKYETNQSEYSQGIKIEVENSISGTNKEGGGTLELEAANYEIRRISGKGWRLAKKSSAEYN